MTGYYSRKSFRMGKVGKLVQVAGHAFELGHEVEMFAAQTLAHTTDSYQLPEDFRARSSGSTGRSMTGGADKRFQLEVMFGIEP